MSLEIIVASVGAGTTVLTGIGLGYRLLWNHIEKSAKDCQKDRSDLWKETGRQNKEISSLHNQVSNLKDKLDHCPQADCPSRATVRIPLPPGPRLIPLHPANPEPETL